MSQWEDLESRLRSGDATAAAEAFATCRERLKRMVRLRLDRRLHGRLDPSDVLQEAYLDVQAKLADYPAKDLPAFLWLRLVVGERLLQLHRFHLGTQQRTVTREVSFAPYGTPAASTYSLANLLLGRLTSPTQAAQRAERRVLLHDALERIDALDREILALRHFEELTNGEAAAVLGLTKTAASNRYIRALKRLKEILATIPGFQPE